MVGKAAPWQKEIYDIVLQANLLGEKTLKAGLTGIQVDGAVRDFIGSKGYVQLRPWSGPRRGPGHPRKTGAEPGQRPASAGRGCGDHRTGHLPADKGGVRIEDTVLVTETGCERLTSVPKELKEL